MTDVLHADFKCDPTPAGINPYVGAGLSGVPDKLLRVMRTPNRLAETVNEAMFLRSRDRVWLEEASGLPASTIDEIVDRGSGCADDVRRVLDCLGVVPIELPGPPALRAAR